MLSRPSARPLHGSMGVARFLVPVLLAAGAVAQTAAPDKWPLPATPIAARAPGLGIVAVPIGPQQPVFGRGDDGGTFLRPSHPPLDQIPPMPMPIERGEAAPLSDSVLMHDAVAGQTVELPLRPRSGLEGGGGAGFVGADGEDHTPEMLRSLGAMSAVSSFTAFPDRTSVKLAMRFIDQTGATRWFSCSGAMQDAGCVLTAAHCVYAREADGPDIYDWAQEIWIYPGWDGQGNAGNSGAAEIQQAWGYTRGVQYIAGTDWINNGNFDRDCAAIRIARGDNRMVGMLTGWLGYAWGYSCGESLSRTYYNFSYPAESCGSPGLHDGRTLYFRSGSFDWPCPGNRLQTYTTPGCFTAVWGGMSGSNAYYFHASDDRRAHAVCSTSDRSSYGRYCKLWEQFAADLNTFRNGTRGSTFDLEPLQFRLTGSGVIQAGSATSPLQFLIANATNADPPNAAYTARIYLSSNAVISPTDTLLGTFGFEYDFAPMQTVPANFPGVAIPVSVSVGNYFIGVILDPASDPIFGNNATSAWDADSVTVTPAPPPPPANNACSAAAVHTVGGTSYGTTTYATVDGAAGCGTAGTADVWYRITPPVTGTLRLDTCGSFFDTVLSAHTVCPGSAGNQVACNDDHAGGAGGCGGLRDSALSMPVAGGASYWVRISGFNGASGNFALHSRYVPPANDDCAVAQDYAAGATITGTLAGATNDGSGACGQSAAGADAWYRLVPAATGNLRIDTCGSAFDTVLSVHTACPGSAANQVACNDDHGSGGAGGCGGLRDSALEVGVVSGTAYLVRVSGYAGAVGAFTLRSQFVAPANNVCAVATPLTPGTAASGVTTGASADGSSGCGSTGVAPDVWYRVTPPCSGLMRFDTCGSGFDTVLSVHTACPGTAANQVACNDDHGSGGAGGCSGVRDSALELAVSAGASYWIRVSGFGGAAGAFNLAASFVHGVATDACEDAPVVGDGSYGFTSCGAVTDGPMEGGCGFGFGDPQVNNDLWVRYRPAAARLVRADTCAGAPPVFDTKIAVYAGSACPAADGTALVCSDDAGSGCGSSPLLSRLRFRAGAGSDYLIRIGGYLNGAGPGVLTIASFCPADTNSDGIVSVQDLFDFLAAWFGLDPIADINGAGGVTVQDLFDFLALWFGGC